jgi:hypothetical protein
MDMDMDMGIIQKKIHDTDFFQKRLNYLFAIFHLMQAQVKEFINSSFDFGRFVFQLKLI